jgi:hypothetical protein
MSWQQDAAAQGGNVHEGDTGTEEVAVRYFTAEGTGISISMITFSWVLWYD